MSTAMDLFGSVQGTEFFMLLSDCLLIKNDSVLWNEVVCYIVSLLVNWLIVWLVN
jgi:hypothetical protein